MERWQVPRGARESRTVPIVDGGGNPIACAGTELLSCVVWAGADRSPILTTTPAFLAAALGTTTVAFTGAQTAALAPAKYRFDCTVTGDDGEPDVYYEAILEIA